MKQHTKEEIYEKCFEIWQDDSYGSERPEFNVKIHDDKIDITVAMMYESPTLAFKHLKSLSEFFETENINDDDRFSQGGCETCDYGSSYGFTLTIRPNGE